MRLDINNVTFSYPKGDHQVLSELTWSFAEGKSTAIMGPSGSGKTTLLALLGGLISPTRGTVVARGLDGPVSLEGAVTWVLQTVSLMPRRTVVDNVAVGAYMDGATRTEARATALRAIARLGLEHRAEYPAAVLSGGEAQRVGIARALASRRGVLLADEPTGQLDAANTDSVLDLLLGAADRTTIMVTHDESAAARCDEVLRLRNGALELVQQ